MAKKQVRYPHTIGFRVTDETWLRIVQEVVGTDLTPHDWCRMVVLDRLDHEYGFSRKERLLFQQIVRTRFLIAYGFQLLADDTLTTDEWKKIRAYAKEKADYLAKQTVADFQSRMGATWNSYGVELLWICLSLKGVGSTTLEANCL